MTTDTERDILGDHRVSLNGEHLETLTVYLEDQDVDSDDYDGPRYMVESYDENREWLDYAEARWAIADIANGLRITRREAIEDEARDLITDLMDSGRTLEILKAIRAAKLI